MTAMRFRVMVIAWMGVDTLWTTMPRHADAYSTLVREALTYRGAGALVQFNDERAWIAFSLGMIAAAAMLFFQNWARYLFALLALYHFLLDPLLGLTISTPLDHVLGTLYSALKWTVLACAFFSPVALKFKPPREGGTPLEGELAEVYIAASNRQARIAAVLLENDGILYKTVLDDEAQRFFVRASEADDARVALSAFGLMDFAALPSR